MSTYFHAKPHCCGPDWLQGRLRLTPDSLLTLALREIRHKAVFLEICLCSPYSGLTGDLAACKCTGGKSQDQCYIFFLSKSIEYLLDFFSKTLPPKGGIKAIHQY